MRCASPPGVEAARHVHAGVAKYGTTASTKRTRASTDPAALTPCEHNGGRAAAAAWCVHPLRSDVSRGRDAPSRCCSRLRFLNRCFIRAGALLSICGFTFFSRASCIFFTFSSHRAVRMRLHDGYTLRPRSAMVSGCVGGGVDRATRCAGVPVGTRAHVAGAIASYET